MRAIKLGLISAVVFFALFTLGGLLLPSHNVVSRAVNIKAKPGSILPLVQNTSEWHLWIEGIDSSAMQQKQTIQIISVSDTLIVANWKTAEANYTTKFRFIYIPGQAVTIVQWQFEQEVKWYPWERLSSLMNDKILGTLMEKNLAKLQLLVEAS
ncbi:MAG: hypothetical protein KGO00_07525 [Bacteroidetes bacterium]|nr:hypothetical protein [Bacteroidota bacterium]